jgi:hypothetical protein
MKILPPSSEGFSGSSSYLLQFWQLFFTHQTGVAVKHLTDILEELGSNIGGDTHYSD